MRRIESGTTDGVIYFVAVDAGDLKTRETGLSSFTVVRSRGGGADVTYTTPTISEIDATTMPGVYALTLDEDTTITAGKLTEGCVLHITHAGMAPVTIAYELFREIGLGPLRTAQGAGPGTLTLASGQVGSDNNKRGHLVLIEGSSSAAGAVGLSRMIVSSVASSDVATLDRAWDTEPAGTITYREIAGSLPTTIAEAQNGLAMEATLGTPANGDLASDIAAVKSDTGATLADTDEMQQDLADGGRLDAILDAILADTGTDGVVLSTATQQAIADALLDRNMATGTDSGSPTVRTVRQALRALRNRVAESSGTVTVYKEDDSTASWTTAITGTPAVTESDPASS